VTPRTTPSTSLLPRPASVPKPGEVESFDAGWNAHEIGLSRDTVRFLAVDPGWALLGYDSRVVAARQESGE